VKQIPNDRQRDELCASFLQVRFPLISFATTKHLLARSVDFAGQRRRVTS